MTDPDDFAALRAAPMTVDAVMALLEPVLQEASDNGNGRDAGGWLATKEAALRTAVELLAQQARAKALDDAAKVAAETVCDMYLPTGVRIYGIRAANAIRAMK